MRSLWITRKSIDNGSHSPELLVAGDEWSIDEYPEDWRRACDMALKTVGSDLASHRYIDLKVSEEALDQAFRPTEIDAHA